MIHYLSTRGQAPRLSFRDVVLAGLASDGGLYVPDTLPHFTPSDLTQMSGLSYPDLAHRILSPFVGESIEAGKLSALLHETYAGFRHQAVAPLMQLDAQTFLLELFHGPTLAFKDFALQCLGRVLEAFLAQEKQELTVIGATSGDTGSAAIAGCAGRKHLRVFILYPHGRVSDVQRRQMTTVADANVHCLAVEGSFDDCQRIVKEMFADAALRDAWHLTAVNSINWLRILAQTVYYFYAALQLGAPARAMRFCVPTGNFGDIYAGYVAQKMGLPVAQLVIATNQNDILVRCLATGRYEAQGVRPSISPSMDIQISSNFERLLFDACDRDAGQVQSLMRQFQTSGHFTIPPAALARIRALFSASSASEEQTFATMRQVYQETGLQLDPHTAVGVSVARRLPFDPAIPTVTLATAHPAKFPDSVLKATGHLPVAPALLQGMDQKPERFNVLPATKEAIQAYMERCA